MLDAADTWADALEPVPTEHLWRCYQDAIRGHRGDRPFGAYSLFTAWENMRTSIVVSQQVGDHQCPDYGCSRAGFIIVDAGGKTPSSNYSGHTYAQACPIHRPQGLPEPNKVNGKVCQRVGELEAERRRYERNGVIDQERLKNRSTPTGWKSAFETAQQEFDFGETLDTPTPQTPKSTEVEHAKF